VSSLGDADLVTTRASFCWRAGFASIFSGQLDLSLIRRSTSFAVPQEKSKIRKRSLCTSNIMKIRLFHNQNGHYLKTIRDWKLAKLESLNFATVAEAREFCHQEGLADMRIVVDYENGDRPSVIFVKKPSAEPPAIEAMNLHHLRERCRELGKATDC
jgi:hypothetical protein